MDKKEEDWLKVKEGEKYPVRLVKLGVVFVNLVSCSEKLGLKLNDDIKSGNGGKKKCVCERLPHLVCQATLYLLI